MVCTGCREDLTINNFSFRNKAKKRYHKRCKNCTSKSFKSSYEKNKTYYNKKRYERQKKRRLENSRLLIELKNTLSCAYCGEKDPRTFDFHHTKTKSFTIANAASIGYPWMRIKKEIEKCKVLCANCHRKLHLNYRAVA
jgi:hypothetical protein